MGRVSLNTPIRAIIITLMKRSMVHYKKILHDEINLQRGSYKILDSHFKGSTYFLRFMYCARTLCYEIYSPTAQKLCIKLGIVGWDAADLSIDILELTIALYVCDMNRREKNQNIYYTSYEIKTVEEILKEGDNLTEKLASEGKHFNNEQIVNALVRSDAMMMNRKHSKEKEPQEGVEVEYEMPKGKDLDVRKGQNETEGNNRRGYKAMENKETEAGMLVTEPKEKEGEPKKPIKAILLSIIRMIRYKIQ
ncbi:hypothetical protein AK88_03800 [Plasmodium fragile]|uniref:Uncharacterized protein n=1 Tax=Plasmodium fragile TaxID=5857 RepID=A0A0D9QHW3_PLAFR|nr:uncharacterized protein AK88_03800 [Plasmodium fragile]KJP86604.1 hypothetical protein AK88_03800 [Plasmodium fragile]